MNNKGLLKKILVLVTITSFIVIAVSPAVSGIKLKTVENMESEKSYSLNSDEHDDSMLSENLNGSINIADFGKIIETKVKWFLFVFFPDTYVIEKHISVFDWDPECDRWHIKMSAGSFGSRKLKYILYEVKVEIEDISYEIDVLLGAEETKFILPVTLEDLEKGDIINVSIEVRGGIVSRILRVPRYRDVRPKNNIGICSFALRDITPPSILIRKPEKAIYIKNTRILLFFTPVIIGDIDIEVDVFDAESGVDWVEFYIDDELKATVATAPYVWRWDEKTRLRHKHMIKAVAYDNAGNNDSDEILVRRFF